MKPKIMMRGSVVALIAMASVLINILPASAGTALMSYSSALECGSPTYDTHGYGQTTGSPSTVTGITVRTEGSSGCTYRAVQLHWWNGSEYIATSLDEQYSQNAAVGANASFGWSSHRLGSGPSGYQYKETSSWM